MQHRTMLSARLPFASASAFATSPRRRAWLFALSIVVIDCFAVGWGSPSSAATDDGSNLDEASFASQCDEGDAVSCNNLGVTYVHSQSAATDAARAFDAFERSCAGGSSDGCSNLGALYERGVGTAVNLTEAARLYEQACDAGAALGCSNLGALYARGQGVTSDRAEARGLFQFACDSGSAAGCHNLMQLQKR